MQNTLLIAIILGIFNVVIGAYRGPLSPSAEASGFTGFSSKLIFTVFADHLKYIKLILFFSVETFKTNWNSDYRLNLNYGKSFYAVFAVFFPSVTGIQAGANISGDLKVPKINVKH